MMTDTTQDTVRIETANSVWVFEPERRRFWRVPRGLDVNSPATARAWQPYFNLELDSDSGAFTVWLDEEGTRLLRSYRLDPGDPMDITLELALQPKD